MVLAKFAVLLAATTSALATGPCPPGTYYSAVDGLCYYSYNGTITWAAALNFCNGVNGQLVVPTNAFENSILSGILQDLGKLESWLGAYSNNQGKWYDMSGNQLNYFRWAPGQPYSTSSCLSIGADGLWYSDSCDDKEEFVCKIFSNVTATSTTNKPTTSTMTRKLQSSTPLPTTTTTRSSYNPDPTRCPGYYAMNSTTPCDYGWRFFLPTCSCYLMSTKTVSWFEAEQNCVSNYKAHLTSVHSAEEAVFVKSLTTDSQKLIHVGLQYNHGWQWSDGTDVSFTNFAQRVYRTDTDKNPCAFIYSDGYYYSTYMGNGPCTLRYYHSVCKKPLPLL